MGQKAYTLMRPMSVNCNCLTVRLTHVLSTDKNETHITNLSYLQSDHSQMVKGRKNKQLNNLFYLGVVGEYFSSFSGSLLATKGFSRTTLTKKKV